MQQNFSSGKNEYSDLSQSLPATIFDNDEYGTANYNPISFMDQRNNNLLVSSDVGFVVFDLRKTVEVTWCVRSEGLQ